MDRKTKTNRRANLSKNDCLVVKYFIPLENEKIPVCAKAFSDITGMTRRKLNILSNSFKKTHSSPKEKRGGTCITLMDITTTVSITNHIQQFNVKNVTILVKIQIDVTCSHIFPLIKCIFHGQLK